MDSTYQDTIPQRPLSTDEVINLKKEADIFEYTAPVVGLASLEDGPGTGSQAVVGFYLGFRSSGAYLMGYEPEREEWESVGVVPSEDVGFTQGMRAAVDELMDWITDHHPGEKLVLYEKGSLRSN